MYNHHMWQALPTRSVSLCFSLSLSLSWYLFSYLRSFLSLLHVNADTRYCNFCTPLSSSILSLIFLTSSRLLPSYLSGCISFFTCESRILHSLTCTLRTTSIPTYLPTFFATLDISLSKTNTYAFPYKHTRSLSLTLSVIRLGDLLDFGQLLKPLATINLSKSLTFLGNFYKDVKINHFSSEIILRQLL